MEQEPVIPVGLCQCGCGRRTGVASMTNKKYGYIKGEPLRYCHGHGSRKHGPDHHLFKGRQMNNGYVYLWAPDHPHCHEHGQKKGYVAEHRLVWEAANGRLLGTNEVVHHINGVRDDNRVENLVAMTHSQHCASHAGDHRNSDPERCRKVGEGQRRRYQDPEERRKTSEAGKAAWVKRRAKS
jgi:hypothetical protein